MTNEIYFGDLIELLLAKREPAQQDYELALADFERARRVLEAKESTLKKVDNMLDECGYERPAPVAEVDEVTEQASDL